MPTVIAIATATNDDTVVDIDDSVDIASGATAAITVAATDTTANVITVISIMYDVAPTDNGAADAD